MRARRCERNCCSDEIAIFQLREIRTRFGNAMLLQSQSNPLRQRGVVRWRSARNRNRCAHQLLRAGVVAAQLRRARGVPEVLRFVGGDIRRHRGAHVRLLRFEIVFGAVVTPSDREERRCLRRRNRRQQRDRAIESAVIRHRFAEELDLLRIQTANEFGTIEHARGPLGCIVGDAAAQHRERTIDRVRQLRNARVEIATPRGIRGRTKARREIRESLRIL